MAKIKVFQPKEECLEDVRKLVDDEGENPTESQIEDFYSAVFSTSDMPLTEGQLDEDLIIDSVEGIINATNDKLRNFGQYDIIEIHNSGTKTQILMLDDGMYEIIED